MSFFPGGPWRFEDRFGVQWTLTRPPASEPRAEHGSPSLAERTLVDTLVFGTFSSSGATHDHRASVVLHVYDDLTNSRLARDLPRPTHDPRRLLRNFDRHLRLTLLHALTDGRLRVEKVPDRPWPFPDPPDKPVAPELAPPLEDKTTWIGLLLLDQDGVPVPRQRVRIVGSDGAESMTALGRDGRVRATNLTSGTCKVTLVDLDYRDAQSPKADKSSSDTAAPTSRTVAQGDTGTGIAAAQGFLWSDTVWADDDNADLRDARPDPNVLLPGDVLAIPARAAPSYSLATGAQYTLRVRRSKLKVRIRLLDWLGNARAAEACFVSFAGEDELPLTTDGDGMLSFDVPADVRTARIECAAGDAFDVSIGGLNPADTLTGVGARLRNLGYYGSDQDAQLEDRLRLRFAVELFADQVNSSPKGDANSAFADAIRNEYGT